MDPQQVLTISRDGLLTLITVVAPLMLVVGGVIGGASHQLSLDRA